MGKFGKINILYEDNHILVVEKPEGIPVCADDSGDIDLVNMLKMYIKDKYNKPGNVFLGMVHRLDRPVGGVMVFARTSKAARRLSEQIRDHKFLKVYCAVCENKIPREGTFRDYLVKNKSANISYVSDGEKGKEAILDYKVLKYKKNFSLVEVMLKTGRSHQIRVQFSSRGYPLVGDVKYNSSFKKEVNVALFAKRLVFYHPISGDKMIFELKMPKRYPFSLF